MFISHSNRSFFKKPLPEVLEKFYPAEILWKIMLGLGYSVLGKNPPEKKPKKSEMVELLQQVLASDQLIINMFNVMDPRLYQLLTVLVWDGDHWLSQIEDKLGFNISDKKTVRPKYSYDRERVECVLKPDLFWVVFEVDQVYYGKQGRVSVRLPPALRGVLRQYMPKPRGYTIEPVDTVPSEIHTFRCDDFIAEDFRVVADYIARGHLEFNKNETIRKPCIRALEKLTEGGEFFPGEKASAKLPLLRHELIISIIAACGPTLRNAMLEEPPDPKKLLRPLCDELFSRPEWFHEIVIPHLKSNGWENYSKDGVEHLRGVFAQIPVEQWVTGLNLERVVNYQGIEIDPIPTTRLSVTIDRTSARYDYSPRVEVDASNGWALLQAPLLQGTAFLLSALGLAEIAYTLPPEHAMWKRPKEQFLTPFDGLYAIRLTRLGAYAFGLCDEVELKTIARQRVEILLNPQRLTAICRHVDPVTEMSLLEFMEKISDGCYRMTRQSLLRGCRNSNDAKDRIEQFKQQITETLPELWENFLEKTARTATALRAKPRYKVYELSDNPELRRLFMSDTLLREKALKVEGMRVAVEKADQPAVAKRLGILGYLMQ